MVYVAINFVVVANAAYPRTRKGYAALLRSTARVNRAALLGLLPRMDRAAR